MTRAVNINMSVAQVTAACASMGATISAIEMLAGGGTRVVLASGDAADQVRAHYGKKLLGERMARVPTRLMTR